MISIVMATYNGEKYIGQQINSIMRQSYNDWELIICDDLSKDNTFNIIKSYAKNEEKIRLFQNKKNLGFKKNFEKAINYSNGDFIAFCDQDDIWTDDHLSILINNIDNNDMIGANAELIDKDGIDLGVDMLSNRSYDFLPTCNRDFFFFLLNANIFQGTASLVRAELVRKCIPIPECVKFHDYWFALMAANNHGIKYINKIILKYRQHENNITENKVVDFKYKIKSAIFSNKSRSQNKDQILLLRAFDSYCSRINKDVLQKEVKYFEKISDKNFFHRVSQTKYFLRNYENMFLSKKYKFERYIKKIIFGK